VVPVGDALKHGARRLLLAVLVGHARRGGAEATVMRMAIEHGEVERGGSLFLE
jgi:hypothetical protein